MFAPGAPARYRDTVARAAGEVGQRVGELGIECRGLRRVEGLQRRVSSLRGSGLLTCARRRGFCDEIGRVLAGDAIDGVVDGGVDNGRKTRLGRHGLRRGEDGPLEVGVPLRDGVGADAGSADESSQREAGNDEALSVQGITPLLADCLACGGGSALPLAAAGA